MTGTSLDAVDMAILETDGETIEAFGPAGERKLSDPTRQVVLRATQAAKALPRDVADPEVFGEAAALIAQEHFDAADAFLAANKLAWSDIDLIGMHGQTVFHERPKDGVVGRTIQLGDAHWLAGRTGVPVAYDFRTADVAAGGEGAPLVPVYHRALAERSGLAPPLAILNLGGVANITLLFEDGEMLAFDTGPANGMVDLLVQKRGAGRYDAGGRYASVGRVDEGVLKALLSHPFFEARPPKSLDRFDFPLDPVEPLHLEDAAATLVAFTAEGVKRAFDYAPEPPREVIACGGGRHNPEIMKALRARLPCPVRTAEDVGWRGDAIEAEAFAYLAARAWNGLPITFPTTTAAPRPMTGGRIARP